VFHFFLITGKVKLVARKDWKSTGFVDSRVTWIKVIRLFCFIILGVRGGCTLDGCIDTDIFQQLIVTEDFLKGMEVQQIAGVGHFPQLEQPHHVNALQLDWLAQHEHT
jgi:hypothetical protein